MPDRDAGATRAPAIQVGGSRSGTGLAVIGGHGQMQGSAGRAMAFASMSGRQPGSPLPGNAGAAGLPKASGNDGCVGHATASDTEGGDQQGKGICQDSTDDASSSSPTSIKHVRGSMKAAPHAALGMEREATEISSVTGVTAHEEEQVATPAARWSGAPAMTDDTKRSEDGDNSNTSGPALAESYACAPKNEGSAGARPSPNSERALEDDVDAGKHGIDYVTTTESARASLAAPVGRDASEGGYCQTSQASVLAPALQQGQGKGRTGLAHSLDAWSRTGTLSGSVPSKPDPFVWRKKSVIALPEQRSAAPHLTIPSTAGIPPTGNRGPEASFSGRDLEDQRAGHIKGSCFALHKRDRLELVSTASTAALDSGWRADVLQKAWDQAASGFTFKSSGIGAESDQGVKDEINVAGHLDSVAVADKGSNTAQLAASIDQDLKPCFEPCHVDNSGHADVEPNEAGGSTNETLGSALQSDEGQAQPESSEPSTHVTQPAPIHSDAVPIASAQSGAATSPNTAGQQSRAGLSSKAAGEAFARSSSKAKAPHVQASTVEEQEEPRYKPRPAAGVVLHHMLRIQARSHVHFFHPRHKCSLLTTGCSPSNTS